MIVEKVGIAYRVLEDDGTENLYIEVDDIKFAQFVMEKTRNIR